MKTTFTPPTSKKSKLKLVSLLGFISIAIGGTIWICDAGAETPSPATRPATAASIKSKEADVTANLRARYHELSDARIDLIAASLTGPEDVSALESKVKTIHVAELAFANAQADAVSQNLQLAAAKAMVDRGRRVPNIPHLTSAQAGALTQLTGALSAPTRVLSKSRAALTQAALTNPRNDTAIAAAARDVDSAELILARARSQAFGKIQSSPEKLSGDQIAAFTAMGGAMQLGGFTEPKPIDFDDHEGYTNLFDGKSLKGWDGNPKFWRVQDGVIVGESTPQNPSGNTYLVYRDLEAKDFTLKFEIKIDGNGGSGMQYRSKTGVPWLAPVDDKLQPVNLDWMMTGPQADFWPSQIYSGQFYSENTPMRIMAWRGQVVEAAGLGTKRLMGNIGTRKALGELEKKNDWNQYTVIARGGTFIHIMNGQLMAVLIDDDPTSSNNESGLIGIEIEAITKLYVRNVWIKKLN